MRFGTRNINRVTGTYGGGVGSIIVANFVNRVLADGGTFEAQSCLISTYNSLAGIDIYPVGDAVIQAFQVRVLADSGTFEAYNCGIIAVQSLANIDLN